MSAASIPATAKNPEEQMETHDASGGSNPEWLRIGAGASLLAGALLILSGNRRAGLVATAAGAVLTVLDQKDTVKAVWDALPGYLDRTQHMLDEAQRTVDDIGAKRDRLKSLLNF